MAFVPLDFVHSNGTDVVQVAVLQTPRDGQFYRIIDAIPTHPKRLGDIFPAHPPSPTGKEPLVLGRHRTLAFRPGNTLDLDAARGALNTPHGIDENNGNHPQGNKFEAARSLRLVVSRPCLATTRADRMPVCSRSHLDFQALPENLWVD